MTAIAKPPNIQVPPPSSSPSSHTHKHSTPTPIATSSSASGSASTMNLNGHKKSGSQGFSGRAGEDWEMNDGLSAAGRGLGAGNSSSNSNGNGTGLSNNGGNSNGVSNGSNTNIQQYLNGKPPHLLNGTLSTPADSPSIVNLNSTSNSATPSLGGDPEPTADGDDTDSLAQTVAFPPQPPQVQKFYRIDTRALKAKLFRALSTTDPHPPIESIIPPETQTQAQTQNINGRGRLGLGNKGRPIDQECERVQQYWRYLGEFVRGKLRGEEFGELMEGVLVTKLQVTLHNQLLTAILHNASSLTPIATTPTIALDQPVIDPTATQNPADPATTDPDNPLAAANKSTDPAAATAGAVDPTNPLKRPLPLDPLDPTLPAQPTSLSLADYPDAPPRKFRVREWMGGMNRSERDRLKRLIATGNAEDHGVGGGGQGLVVTGGVVGRGEGGKKDWSEMQRGFQGRGRLRLNTKPIRPNVINHLHPLIYSSGMLPNQAELKERIESVAKLNGMVEGAADGIQDVLGVALDSHLDSLFYSAVQLKLQEDADARFAEEGAGKGAGERDVGQESRSSVGLAEGGVDENATEGDEAVVELPEGEKAEEGRVKETGGGNQVGLARLNKKHLPIPKHEIYPPDDPRSTPVHINLHDMHSLFTIAPHLHPHLGNATYRLRNGLALHDELVEDEAKELEAQRKAGWPAYRAGATIPDAGEEVYSAVADKMHQELPRTAQMEKSSNAEAGPGPSTASALAHAAAGVARLRTQAEPKEAPSLSKPPTPVPSSAVLRNVPHSGGSSATGREGQMQAQQQRSPPPPTGPGGIVLSRAGAKGSTAGGIGLPPDALAEIGGPFAGGKDSTRRMLEAAGVYKDLEHRGPVVTMGMPASVGDPMMGGMQPAMPDGDINTEGPPQPAQPHQHGAHHWPYIDPAVVLRDILG